MSCTENESGPFVVFFLPAVVGCLTILLARRWAQSQGTNPSSTAVSRRRKIIKDPLVKRPLPPIACPKMVQSNSKKVGVTKKGNFPAVEEDINGGGKRVRATRLSPSTNNGNSVPDIKMPEAPFAPKHIPFPFIPQDGDLLFEAMTFVFTLVATGLQFLNLYRTTWWLPHSHINQAMNFHLINPYVVSLIAILACRRAVLAGALALAARLLAPKPLPHVNVAIRMFTLGVVLGAIAWCMFFILHMYPITQIFFLCYPAVIYFALFGLRASPFLELNSEDPPLHCCSHDTQQIKAEIETISHDFNTRVKKMLFNSIEGAYYSSFIPLCFAQPYLYYDYYAAAQQVAFVWGGLFARYWGQLLPAAYCDTAHRAALHIAHHARTDVSSDPPAPTPPAPPPPPPPRPRPGNPSLSPRMVQHARFFAFFINPSSLMALLLCLQLSLVVVEMCLLFSSIQWHYFLSIVILLFINYYTLFKVIREYLVALKVYRAETMIQEKHYALNYTPN